MESKCKVFSTECGDAHKCISCDSFVHLICGKPVGREDEEGHGQPVKCLLCSKTDSQSKAITCLLEFVIFT